MSEQDSRGHGPRYKTWDENCPCDGTPMACKCHDWISLRLWMAYAAFMGGDETARDPADLKTEPPPCDHPLSDAA